MKDDNKKIYETPDKAKEFRDAHKLNLKPDFFTKKNSETAEKIATLEIDEH